VKKLVTLLVLISIAAGLGLLWFRQSVHFALLEIGRGVRDGNVEVVEKHLDIDAFAKVTVRYYGALAGGEAKRALGDGLLAALAGGAADAIAGAVADEAGPEVAAEVRRKIVQGDVNAFGPFVPGEGFSAIGLVQDREGGKKVVTIVGRCYDETASVNVVFQREPGLFGVPMLGTWRATGVEDDSLQMLAATCRDAWGKAKDAPAKG
jgi:hypothetical protein